MISVKDPKIAIPLVSIAGLFWSFGPYVVRHIDQANNQTMAIFIHKRHSYLFTFKYFPFFLRKD